MSRVEAARLPQDPTLPQLAQALDPGRMAEVFTGLLSGRDVQLRACRVDRVKYRAHRNLSVAYLLDLRDGQGTYTQAVAARFCAAGDAARRHAQARARQLRATRPGPALSLDAGLEMVAHWWPNDAKLAAAAVLADADVLQRRWLPEVARALGAGPCHGHRLEIAQCVPEHRVTARVHLHTSGEGGRTDARPQTHTVYAKSDAETRGPVTQAVMHSLWCSAARLDGRLSVPRALLWQAGSGLQWQVAVPGCALLDAWPMPDDPRAAAVGRLLSALHQTPAPAAPMMTLTGLRQRLQETTQLLGAVQPAQQARLGRVAAMLATGLAHITSGVQKCCILHGDLHPRNVLCDGERLSLIDLDSARRGPALLELGSWLADALYRAQLDGHAHAAVEAAGQAFLRGYEQAGGQAFAPRPIAWATAWQLWCQRMWRCVVNLKPGRYALLPGLLTLTETLLARHEQPALQDVGA
ncbi:MAG: phosphotransferase [Rubrivivax sp.]|nr:phosphotransferase [Rubrivivax sp.]